MTANPKSICRLCSLLKQDSKLAYPVDWNLLEAQVTFTLPEDYKLICEIFGAGSFGWQETDTHFLTLSSPLIAIESSIPIAVFPDNIYAVSNSFNELLNEFPDNYPSLQFYPDMHGLINWGHDSNGNYYFWNPKDLTDPQQWKIFIIKRDGRCVDFDGNLVACLIDILTNQLVIASGFQIAGNTPVYISALKDAYV